MNREFLVSGLDLGKAADFAVLAVVGRRPLENPTPKRKHRYALRWLQAWDLGTPYTATQEGERSVIGDVKDRFEAPALRWTPLAVDYTGIGMVVVEQVKAAKVKARLNPVCITSGHTAQTPDETKDRSWHVPKVELIGTLVTLLQAKLLTWQAPGTPGALGLVARWERELQAFREFITRKKNVTYGAEASQHDDIVLAVALACYIGERVGTGDPRGIGGPDGADASCVSSAPAGVFHGGNGV